jgi:hypothetical protein
MEMNVTQLPMTLTWLLMRFLLRAEVLYSLMVIVVRVTLVVLLGLRDQVRNSLIEILILGFMAYLGLHLS